jgi:hypothetical protein
MSCITYYTQFTQNDPPVRQQNFQGGLDETITSQPCNTWICDNTASEHECLGIKYDLFEPTDIPTPAPFLIGSVKSGRYMTLEEWKDAWSTNNCKALFQNMVQGYGTTNNSSFSPLGFQYVQEDMAFIFSRFFNHDPDTAFSVSGGSPPKRLTGKQSNIPLVPPQQGIPIQYCLNPLLTPLGQPIYPCIYDNTWIGASYNLTTPGNQGYDTFLATLLDTCKSIPGACNLAQISMCDSCSREEIFANKAVQTFCGCVAPSPGENDFYNSSLKNFDPTCDPICNKGFTIKNVDSATGLIKQCNANVCVIDNVAISSIETEGASPTFTQVCPACADGSGNCICIINATFETTISGILGSDGQSINTPAKFTQVCPNSQCYINNALTGELEQVACADSVSKKLLEKSGLAGPPIVFPTWVIFVFVALLIIAILVIFAYKHQSENVQVYEYVSGRTYYEV